MNFLSHAEIAREYVVRWLASLDALLATEWKKRADAAEKANADWAAWLASELGCP